jgi:hypothetical protein
MQRDTETIAIINVQGDYKTPIVRLPNSYIVCKDITYTANLLSILNINEVLDKITPKEDDEDDGILLKGGKKSKSKKNRRNKSRRNNKSKKRRTIRKIRRR